MHTAERLLVRSAASRGRSVPGNGAAARQFRDALLPPTLRNAVRHSPFYREFHGGRPPVRTVEDLPSLPVLSKDLVSDNHARLLTSATMPALVQHTTGSTGIPLPIYRSADEISCIRAFFQALVETESPAPLPIVLHLVDNYHGQALEIPARQYPLQGGVTDDILLQQTEHLLTRTYDVPGVEHHVSTISGLVPYVKTLTQYLLERQFDFGRLRLRTLCPLCTIVTPRWRKLLTDTWGARVVDRYSLSEIFGGATFCLRCERYHFDPLIIPEVIDPNTQQPVRRGVGLLVLTSLFPFVQLQPMIRYRTDDLVEAGEGCTGDLAVRFLGRNANALWLDLRGRKRLVIAPVDLYEELDALPDVNFTERFIDSRSVLDHSAAGSVRCSLRADRAHAHTRVVLEIELRYSPHLYADHVSDLRREIISKLMNRSPELRGIVTNGDAEFTVCFRPPGQLSAYALKV